jgi:hypothetical protein
MATNFALEARRGWSLWYLTITAAFLTAVGLAG